MIKSIKIVSLSIDNENEVVINVEGAEIVCFITSCPYFFNIGQEYMVDLTLFFLEDHCEINLSESESGFKKIDSGYSYYLYGRLNSGSLVVNNICFYDDFFLEFYDLEGESVMVRVDRIDIAFL